MENSRLSIVAMAEKCKRVLGEWDEYDSRLPTALQQHHLVWMCNKIEEHSEAGSLKKLHRWIGFVQAAILAHRMLDLNELKSMFDEAKRAHGETGDDLLDHLDPASSFEFDIGGQG